jgi:hypothetical protein
MVYDGILIRLQLSIEPRPNLHRLRDPGGAGNREGAAADSRNATPPSAALTPRVKR